MPEKKPCDICERDASYLSDWRCSLCHLRLCESCYWMHGCFMEEDEAILELVPSRCRSDDVRPAAAWSDGGAVHSLERASVGDSH